MRVGSINSNMGPTHGIYRNETISKIGDEEIRTVHGQYKDKKITIYNEYIHNKKFAKLIYISDLIGNFIKLKLFKYDKDGNKQTMLKQGRWL